MTCFHVIYIFLTLTVTFSHTHNPSIFQPTPPLSIYPFTHNRTISINDGDWTGVEAEGFISWPELSTPRTPSAMSVLVGLITPQEIQAILAALPHEFDEDLDTVDGQTTYEFYLSKSGGFEVTDSYTHISLSLSLSIYIYIYIYIYMTFQPYLY